MQVVSNQHSSFTNCVGFRWPGQIVLYGEGFEFRISVSLDIDK